MDFKFFKPQHWRKRSGAARRRDHAVLPTKLLRDQGSLDAVGLGAGLHGTVGVGGGEEVVQRGGQIGTLAEADAVLLAFLGVQADGVGQAVVARALADHGAGHQGVDDGGVGRTGGDLHQRGGLILDLGEAGAQLLSDTIMDI